MEESSLVAFIIAEIDKRKAARKHIKAIKWTKNKYNRVAMFADYVAGLAAQFEINPQLLAEVLLNKLFPLHKRHAPLTRLLTDSEQYMETLSDATIETMQQCKNWNVVKRYVLQVIQQWNIKVCSPEFIATIAGVTGASFKFAQAFYYGPDFLPTLNLLVKYIKMYPYSSYAEFVKEYFKPYTILGCRRYIKQESFRNDFHLYHIAANSMPDVLLPKLEVRKMFKPAPNVNKPIVEISIENVRESVLNTTNIDVFPDILSPTIVKSSKLFNKAIIEVFYEKVVLPVGVLYKRRPIAILPPSLFKSLITTVKVKTDVHLDNFQVVEV